jgi:hypothetical protein
MLDKQLEKLTEVLKLERIWAVNVGENFEITQNAWQDFARGLPATAVSHLYVEEQNLAGTNLKRQVCNQEYPHLWRSHAPDSCINHRKA